MATVIFSFEGKETYIQCLKEDKMNDICNKFSSKLGININMLYFLYNGNQINLQLTFEKQANSLDNKRNQMNILVYKHENDGLKCKKCGESISLPLLDNILKNNCNQKDILIELKNQIENIINLHDINEIIRKIKLIKIVINDLIIENEKNQKEFKNILNNALNIKNNNTNNENNNINKLNQKQKNYNFEIVQSEFNSSEEKMIKAFVVDSVSKYSDYKEISKSIGNKCNNWKNGIWIISVGEKDKYASMSNCQNWIGGYIDSYKILLFYST